MDVTFGPNDELPCCLASVHAAPASAPTGPMLPLPGLNDVEGEALPTMLPPVVDAHVHLFPDGVFEAIWRWFNAYGWPIRYPLHTPQVIEFLLSRGVKRLVALHYAHKPGMARSLNQYIAQIQAQHPQVTGLGTVLPGEPEAKQIVEEAFGLGLHGLKLHCHVQRMSPDDESLFEIYETAARHGKPVIIHAGREPRSAAYPIDPVKLCAVERVERVLKAHPALKLVVPHLGADEFDGYQRLLERYENLWLDTTMVAADYLPVPNCKAMIEARPERILYGTDFPNLPYAWDREVTKLLEMRLKDDSLAGVLGQNALALFGQSVAVSAPT